ncbi:MAG: Gfo/Idh/MocA family oxidoreductase [Candidatus Hydrogenedentota bacterium]
MRFLIIGCGSMGKRRARCLHTMGYGAIAAYDPREDRRSAIAEQPGVNVFSDAEAAFNAGADFALICAPPHAHKEYLLRCIDASIPAFCEAPMVLTLEDADEVMARAKAADVFIAPSCTYLHNAIHRTAKAFVDEKPYGRLLGYLSHAGQHVADWHPYEDYREFYASKRSEGGMCIDMLPHEFQMLSWFAGEVGALACMARRRSTDIQTDKAAFDTYDILIDMRSNVSAVVHHDMVQRPPVVMRKLVFESGIVEYDWRSLRHAKYEGPAFTGKPDWKEASLDGYDFERMYIDELEHAIEARAGKTEYLIPLERERRTLELVLACEESSQKDAYITWQR